ncbi:hypothetical protein LUZ60_003725 [Juncus effusus]|nr:hypothetical protein LUZ60_003725 [Juncus effusus]
MTINKGGNDIHVEIIEQSHHGSSVDQYHPHRITPSPFAPEHDSRDGSIGQNVANSTNQDPPEKEIAIFALRLAVLEKAASGLGTLAFVWATVVLLGGFAFALTRRDFWFVTVILVVEGARIYSRSGELEWQHRSTWNIATAGSSVRGAMKTSSHFFVSVVKACLHPLSSNQKNSHINSRQQLPETPGQSSNTQRTWNSVNVPLISFRGRVFMLKYVSRVLVWLQVGLAVGSMALSLIQLTNQQFGRQDDVPTNRDTALNLFYGLALADDLLFLLEKLYWIWKMDLVSFAGDLVVSSSPDEQLMGAQILKRFITNKQFADETLRKVGTSGKTIEKLVEMLSWKNTTEAEIRLLAAEIVSKVSQKTKFSLRVAGIPGSMEAIASLLQIGSFSNNQNEPTSSGLPSRVIEFTRATPNLLQNDHAAESQIKLVKRALQVVKLLVATKGNTGNRLRKKISENVFMLSNIREILKYGESHVILQKLSSDILASLAMDEEATERIASTGGVIKLLLASFFKLEVSEDRSLCEDAGEALAMLTLKSEKSCNLVLRESDILKRLIEALKGPPLCLHASRILRNLCAYAAPESSSRLYLVTEALPIVLQATSNATEKQLEVSIGLLIEACKFMEPAKFNEELDQAGITQFQLVERLISILREYIYPDIKVPRVRRFVIELAIWLMRSSSLYRELFKNVEMKVLLESVAETTSEVENFHVFSGSVGLSQHSSTLVALVDEALEVLHIKQP